MKPQKDIFDQFREKGRELQEQPSSQAWSKLERKLNRQRGRRRVISLRSYLMAASVVGLLVVVTLVSGVFDTADSSPAMAEAKAQARQLEDLVMVDSDETVIAYQRTYQAKVASQPIEEGTAEKKLVVRP